MRNTLPLFVLLLLAVTLNSQNTVSIYPNDGLISDTVIVNGTDHIFYFKGDLSEDSYWDLMDSLIGPSTYDARKSVFEQITSDSCHCYFSSTLANEYRISAHPLIFIFTGNVENSLVATHCYDRYWTSPDYIGKFKTNKLMMLITTADDLLDSYIIPNSQNERLNYICTNCIPSNE